ncbi:MAG: acylphosphatase, partial [Nitrososphaerales archaeon]
MSKQKIAYMIRVEGRVQRVGYRRFILENAQELGIEGYVRNEKDGSVKIFAQGEEDNLNQFLDIIKVPPLPISIKSF